jgi:hypothetical protein
MTELAERYEDHLARRMDTAADIRSMLSEFHVRAMARGQMTTLTAAESGRGDAEAGRALVRRSDPVPG